MIEAKAKDLALLRLRPDMLRFAPEAATIVGSTAAAGEGDAADEPQ